MPTSSLKLLAPAKVNLFLHICGRRSDGYHNLQTVFQFLSLADSLEFQLRKDTQLNLKNTIAGIDNADNLIIKAAKLLQETYHVTQGVDISINKILPMGAGLGGGSSNAATTLVALNRLWQLNLSPQELQHLGLQLGADVPIFLYGKSAWAEGIGEKLSPISLAENWYLLLIPNCHVSTAKIFSHPQLTRDSKMLKMAAFLEQGDQAQFRNDCETLVKSLYPEVEQAFNLLDNLAEARMTGTGACIFAQFDSKETALQAAKKLPQTMQYFVCQGQNSSALYSP